MITYSYYYYISFSKYGNTPLHEAALYGREDVVKLLIENGANLYIKNHVSN